MLFKASFKACLLYTSILLSFLILFFLSGYIWNIHVEGNIHNSTQSILSYLEKIDVRHGVSKKNLNCAVIAEKLRGEFPNITWVSAKITGSRLFLEIKENDNIYTEKIPEKGAYDLVSDKTGKIVSMVTRKGTPVKKTGDSCKDVYKRQIKTRVKGRIPGNLAGGIVFLLVYPILPEAFYPYIGVVGGIGVGLSATYGWQAVFNSFGAMAIACLLYTSRCV